MRLPTLDRVDAYVDLHAARSPAQVAIRFGDASWTWPALRDEVDRAAGRLVTLGVGRGDRVAVLGRSRPETLALFLGAARVGAIFLGLNPKYTVGELRHAVEDASPALLVATTGEDEQLHKLAQLGAPVDPEAWARTAAAPPPVVTARAAAVRATDPCALVYTSGSTGRPKGALLTHHGLVRCSLVQDEHWDGGASSLVCDLPVNHVGWLGDLVSAIVVAGGTLVLHEAFDPEATLAATERHRLTVLAGVPAMLDMLVASSGWRSRDLSSVERVVWSGAAARPALVETLAATGAQLSTSYGMTETTGSVTFTAGDASLEALAASIGRPDPRYDVRIAPGDGELQVRASSLFAGYLGRPEATAEAFTEDGFLRTGDVARERPDGNLELVGRLKEMFKSGGYNVYPREVEEALREHPGVAEVVVVPVADERWSEVGHAWVVPADGGFDPAPLRAFAAERLANYKVPKTFSVVEALPLLPIGKVDRQELRRRAAAGRSTAPA